SAQRAPVGTASASPREQRQEPLPRAPTSPEPHQRSEPSYNPPEESAAGTVAAPERSGNGLNEVFGESLRAAPFVKNSSSWPGGQRAALGAGCLNSRGEDVEGLVHLLVGGNERDEDADAVGVHAGLEQDQPRLERRLANRRRDRRS